MPKPVGILTFLSALLFGTFSVGASQVLRYEIQVRELHPQATASVRETVKASEVGDELGHVLPDIFSFLQKKGVTPSGSPFTRYFAFNDGSIDLEAGLPVTEEFTAEGKIQSGELPGGLAAVTLHTGSYEKLPLAYQALQAWIRAHDYVPAGAPWEVYLSDPAETKTEVLWPIQPKAPSVSAR